MDADFSAAHSMDTTWYAVDGSGHVAFFETGEDGHAPAAARDEALVMELWRLRGGDTEEWHEDEEMAGKLGVFFYDSPESGEMLIPYDRVVAPDKPLHVDELPPGLRTKWKRIRFDTIAFAESEKVQPLEFVECVSWGEYVAYLCADGETVRPVPGQEKGFAAFCRMLLRDRPEFARGLRFEGPGAGGRKPPGKGRKKGGR
jgi:hypothetical protein